MRSKPFQEVLRLPPEAASAVFLLRVENGLKVITHRDCFITHAASAAFFYSGPTDPQMRSKPFQEVLRLPPEAASAVFLLRVEHSLKVITHRDCFITHAASAAFFYSGPTDPQMLSKPFQEVLRHPPEAASAVFLLRVEHGLKVITHRDCFIAHAASAAFFYSG